MQMLNGADRRCLVNSLPFSLPEEQTLPNSLQSTPQSCERPCLLHEKVTTKDYFISLYPIQVWKTSDNYREGSGGTEPEPEHGGVTCSLSLLDRSRAPLSHPSSLLWPNLKAAFSSLSCHVLSPTGRTRTGSQSALSPSLARQKYKGEHGHVLEYLRAEETGTKQKGRGCSFFLPASLYTTNTGYLAKANLREVECNSQWQHTYLKTHRQQQKLKWSQQTEQENYTGELCHPRPPLSFESLQLLVNRRGKKLLHKI